MGDLINGRTPEEIKSVLAICSSDPAPCNLCPNADMSKCADGAMIDALALVERLEAEHAAALAKVPKWISVEERLPEECDIYLAHVMHSYNKEDLYALVCVEYFNPEDGWSSLSDLYEVTHWMPLPEPPKEGE